MYGNFVLTDNFDCYLKTYISIYHIRLSEPVTVNRVSAENMVVYYGCLMCGAVV